MIGRLFKVLLLLLICCGAVAGVFYYKVQTWAQSSVSIVDEPVVQFPTGTSLDHVANNLFAAQIIDSPLLFKLWVKIERSYPKFQAGQYKFSGQLTPQQVAAKFIAGDIFHPVVMRYTIPEGFTLKQVIDRLVANNIGTHSELTQLTHDSAFLKQLNVNAKSLEGYIYPATYSFITKVKAREALTHMVETFWSKLPKNYNNKVAKLGLSLHEAITFASLIELETKHDDEKPLISEVIWSRLKDKVPLAIDASIIYGIKDYDGDLRWKHLDDKANPYNSRVHRGLPPGPIGAPSASSMEAILNPTSTGAYYYVLKPGSDRHHFSKTLKEHNQNVRKLIEATRRRSRR